MSTTALHIIELVKSLPVAEQQAICQALARHGAGLPQPSRPHFQRDAEGNYYSPEGIPNDHAFFRILEADEAARRLDFGPPPPDFD